MVLHPAALDLPHALVEWVTMLIVAREGDRLRKLRPSQHAMVALVYLREHTTLAKIAAGFGISESTAHAYTGPVVDLLVAPSPSPAIRTTPETVPTLTRMPLSVLMSVPHRRIGTRLIRYSLRARTRSLTRRSGESTAEDRPGKLRHFAPPHLPVPEETGDPA